MLAGAETPGRTQWCVEVTVMIDSVGGNVSVVSLFPRGGPNIVNFVLEEMRAFRALITGVQ